MSDKNKMGLVHALIDDAKMALASAIHHHEKPAAGANDHARAIAKARGALGFAQAPEMLAKRWLREGQPSSNAGALVAAALALPTGSTRPAPLKPRPGRVARPGSGPAPA